MLQIYKHSLQWQRDPEINGGVANAIFMKGLRAATCSLAKIEVNSISRANRIVHVSMEMAQCSS
jgi:hypothetical protein